MPSGGARKLAGLKWKPADYYTYNLLNGDITLEDMAKEYNRLRGIANQRLDRFAKSEFATSDVYRFNKGQYDKPASAYNKSQLAKKLYQVSKMIGSEGGSIRGQQRIRNKTITSLHNAGFKFINKKNLKEFGQFMEEMRARAGGRLLDSDRVAEVFNVAKNLKVDSKTLSQDFEWWLANINKLKQMKPLKGTSHSSDEYLALLDGANAPKEYQYSKSAKALKNKLNKK